MSYIVILMSFQTISSINYDFTDSQRYAGQWSDTQTQPHYRIFSTVY